MADNDIHQVCSSNFRIAGVIVLIFEVPICCTFIEITKPIAAFAERRTFFQKAIIFGV